MKVSDELLKRVIRERPRDSHKGSYGRLLLLGGTYPYGGAIIMAALAAVRSGAGLVTVGTDRDNISPLHSHLPEAMAFDLSDQEILAEQLGKAELVLLGPGLNTSNVGEVLLRQVFDSIGSQQILILDGGALALMARLALPLPKAQVILTPHQKEWEGLSGLALADQSVEKTKAALKAFPAGTIIVQKSAQTKIWQSGEEDYYQLAVGGPYQATGGMGDTLAGMIAGFSGQFPQVSLYERVVAATHLHSAIAESLSKDHYVVLPTDISRQIPKFMKESSN